MNWNGPLPAKLSHLYLGSWADAFSTSSPCFLFLGCSGRDMYNILKLKQNLESSLTLNCETAL